MGCCESTIVSKDYDLGAHVVPTEDQCRIGKLGSRLGTAAPVGKVGAWAAPPPAEPWRAMTPRPDARVTPRANAAPPAASPVVGATSGPFGALMHLFHAAVTTPSFACGCEKRVAPTAVGAAPAPSPRPTRPPNVQVVPSLPGASTNGSKAERQESQGSGRTASTGTPTSSNSPHGTVSSVASTGAGSSGVFSRPSASSAQSPRMARPSAPPQPEPPTAPPSEGPFAAVLPHEPVPSPPSTVPSRPAATLQLPRRANAAVAPPRSNELFRLQFRDVTPDDYDLLTLLDEVVPKREVLPHSLVHSLPCVLASECPGVSRCPVCLVEFSDMESVVRLPCSHAFHPECVTRWLTQCKDTCPVCLMPV